MLLPDAGTSGGPQGAAAVPIGGIIMFGSNTGADVPTGWALCNGAAISRATFATLFALIGITFGAGDGLTTFNLPDFRSRKPVGAGQGTGLSAYALGATGGEETHVQTLAELVSHTHAQGTHTHAVAPNPHEHNVQVRDTADPDHLHELENVAGQPNPFDSANQVPTDSVSLSLDAVATPIDPEGGGVDFNVLDPYLAVGFIIRVS